LNILNHKFKKEKRPKLVKKKKLINILITIPKTSSKKNQSTGKLIKMSHILLNRVLLIKANGEIIKEKVMEFKNGQMELDMRGIGKIIKLMDTGNFFMLMVMFLRESGNLIKLMDMVYIIILMEQNMKAIGKTIFNTDTALKSGMTVVNIEEIMYKVKSKDKELTNG